MIEVSYENIPEDKSYEYIIDRVVKEVLKEEKIVHDVSVDVILTDNDEIQKLNKEHRQIDSPTDVLSFPMYEKDEINKLKEPKEDDVEETLGDIVVSIPKVKEQAEEYGHSVERELAYLVCHGMHHLLGYDHIEEEDKKVMREHEEAVLSNLQFFRVGDGESLLAVDRVETKEDVEPAEETTKLAEEVKASTIEEMSADVNAKIDSIINENIAESKAKEEEETTKVVPVVVPEPEPKPEPAPEQKPEPKSVEEPKKVISDYNITYKNTKTKSSSSTLPIIIAFLIVLLIVGLLVYFLVIKPMEDMSGAAGIVESGDISGEELSGDEEPEIIEEEPYTGPTVFSGDSRSIAFMIDNDVKASLPHAGLNNAYMVYEIIVEGGASRLMAVFKYDNLPDKIGPIRSCRHYFLDYVQEHDALYCHIGQSTQGGEALRDRSIQHIETDHARIGPDRTWHNAFAVKEKVYKTIENRGWRTTQTQDCIIKFNEKDIDLDSKEYADVITCKFPVSTTEFKYDEERKVYLIDMKGTPHVDKFNGEQSYAKNLLVYQIDNKSVWEAWGDHREEDNKKRQEIYNTGTGKGYYITNGKAIEMYWSKPTHSSKTKYTDKYGNEIKFNDGITWVEIIPSNGSYKITSNHQEETSGEVKSGDLSNKTSLKGNN
ncbi:MAG: rRNA maturation RNase YbeY [Clostridia bacterium]|nr:rRNA maturation RNase YbeY [Clostridia bacterium]